MKKKTRILLFVLAFFLLAATAAGLIAWRTYQRYFVVTVTPAAGEVTAEHLDNPYRGWYHIYGHTLSDTGDLDEAAIRSFLKDSMELTLLEVNLRNYKSTEIGSKGISQLDTLLSYWEKAGKQLIVRFLYNWSGSSKELEPDDISIILGHMDQVSQILNRHTDCVYLVQGIFVGDYGEMHDSDYMETESMKQLAEHLASVLDPAIYLAVRTPAQWRTINETFEPLAKKDAYSQTLSSRMGLFNDGMFGSVYDLGTYGDTSLEAATSYTAKGTLEEELEFQNQLCSFVPNGGEAVFDQPRSNFPKVLSPLAQMHVSYLDYDYDTAALDKWRASTYTGEDCFQGTNGFDYIGEHLGYRYAIRSIGCTFHWKDDETATMSIDLENSGFSACYRRFDSKVTLVQDETNTTYELPLELDNRCLNGGATITAQLSIPIREYGPGSYQIYFSMTDPSLERAIGLANSYQSTAYGYRLGSLSVRKHT